MKRHIFAGLIIASAFAATSVAQAAIFSPVDELYSGMSAAAIQQDQRANPAAARYSSGKATCDWQEAEVVDQVYAPYPGSEHNFGGKDYLAEANFRFSC